MDSHCRSTHFDAFSKMEVILGWVILGLFGGDLLVMDQILAIGASFPYYGSDEICGEGLVALAV